MSSTKEEAGRPVVETLHPDGEITTLRPLDPSEFPATLKRSRTGVVGIHSQLDTRTWDQDLGYVYLQLFGKGLADGWLKPHPLELRDGGLNAVEGALGDLKDDKNNAKKYIFCIGEAECA
jgi:NADPH:quinone reductase